MITQEKAKELMVQGRDVYWARHGEYFKCWYEKEESDFLCQDLSDTSIEPIDGLWDYDEFWYTAEEFKAMEAQ